MKKVFGIFWENIKIKPDIWFFFGFLLTFTLSIRKVVLYFPIKGTFNEYTGVYIYLSDIFLILTIGSWLFFLLSTKLTNLSNYSSKKKIFGSLLACIRQKIGFDNLWTKPLIHILYWVLPISLVVSSFFSITWSQNKEVALFRSFKLFELFLLYLYISQRFFKPFFGKFSDFRKNVVNKNGFKESICLKKATGGVLSEASSCCSAWNILKTTLLIVIFIGLAQSIIAILQFVFQHSLELVFLRESYISPDFPGVAKVVFYDQKFIRAYGLFPHPNVLGGFLVFSIVVSFLYYKLFHVEQFVISKIARSNFNNTESNNIQSVKRGKCFKQDNESIHIFDKIWKLGKKGLILATIFGLLMAFLGPFYNTKYLASISIIIIISVLVLIVEYNISKRHKCSTWNIKFNLFRSWEQLRGVFKNAGSFFNRSLLLNRLTLSANINIVPRGTIKRILKFNKKQSSVGLFISGNNQSFRCIGLDEELIYKNTNCFTWNNFKVIRRLKYFTSTYGQKEKKLIQNLHIFDKIWKIEKKGLIVALILVQLLALLLTFSKSAILALTITFGYIIWRSGGVFTNREIKSNCSTSVLWFKNVPCPPASEAGGTLIFKELNGMINIRIITLSVLIIFFSGWLFLKPDLNSIFFQSLDERVLYLNVSRGTIAENPILGVGMGQFVIDMQKYAPFDLQSWQFQPVHNVFILVWSELGLIGLVIFIVYLVIIIFNDRFYLRGNKIFHVEHFGFAGRPWNNLWIGRVQRLKNMRTKDVLNKQKWGSLKKREKCGNSVYGGISGRHDVPQECSTLEKREEDYFILEHNIYKKSIEFAQICFKGILLGFIFISLFDHYFWDIWQGQVMFWMILGVIVGIKRKC